ncbi:hypothetical protein NDU88_000950 [Pleurodeles waltl]|uniref:Uncharacterized protein n=1 Tax=Pleurodeles waltl TaxID=8319 RepID=A0AAV7MRD0_PLEWA|nr:hypothetical protein NDU88_000950 [Pleurodeles waltl]
MQAQSVMLVRARAPRARCSSVALQGRLRGSLAGITEPLKAHVRGPGASVSGQDGAVAALLAQQPASATSPLAGATGLVWSGLLTRMPAVLAPPAPLLPPEGRCAPARPLLCPGAAGQLSLGPAPASLGGRWLGRYFRDAAVGAAATGHTHGFLIQGTGPL